MRSGACLFKENLTQGLGTKAMDDPPEHPLYLLAGLTLLFQEAETSRSKDSGLPPEA